MPEEKKRSVELGSNYIRGGLEFVMPEVYENRTMNKVGCSNWTITIFNKLRDYIIMNIASDSELVREINSKLKEMETDRDFSDVVNHDRKLLKKEHCDELITLAKRALEALSEDK